MVVGSVGGIDGKVFVDMVRRSLVVIVGSVGSTDGKFCLDFVLLTWFGDRLL